VEIEFVIMVKNYLKLLLVILTLLLTTSFSDKPRILIIGDSISMDYTPYVQDYFKDKAIVVRIPENGQHTGFGLKRIREYIGNEKWDIIQFNYGLHDLCYRHPDSKLYGRRDKIKGKLPFSIDTYEANLDSLVTIMKELSNAKLIFVTTNYNLCA